MRRDYLNQESELLQEYERIKILLEINNINIKEFKLIDFGLQFKVFINDWYGLIRIYQNKNKILNIDYSQLRNSEYSIKIKNLIEDRNTSLYLEKENGEKIDLDYPIIGTDEAGKGDYFGPLVSAGVYVDENSAEHLRTLGVKDSKLLSDKKNQQLAPKIAELCKNKTSIIEISPETYNALYKQFRQENKNLNTLLAWGHAKAIEEILSKVKCEVAVIDQFADEKYILSKLQEKGKKLKLIQMHKAGTNIAVASASILARARFLEKLSQLSTKFGIDFPKGASQKVIDTALIFIKKYGEGSLGKVAKLHFKTTDKALGKMEK